MHRDTAAAVPLGAGVHLVPEATRVVDCLPGDDVGQSLGALVVGRHLDQGLHDLGRRVAFADSDETIVAMHAHDDIPIAALEAIVGGLRVLQAEDFHPLDGHGHGGNTRRA